MSTLEANVAIVAASIPAIKPLFTRAFPCTGFLKPLCNSYGRSNIHVHGEGDSCAATMLAMDIENRNEKERERGTAFNRYIPPYDAYGTTAVSSNAEDNGTALTEEDLGFPDGFDGKSGTYRTIWDDPCTSGNTDDAPRAKNKKHSETIWIDREIDIAFMGRDMEAFKKGNLNARMNLVDALRGGPIGILPDLPDGSNSRRQSEAHVPYSDQNTF
ncbi:hypothetical protein DRE_04831 [Drechslerella stenobrocha 248]|uniref:Uncharacterized protein n=1 Tax=Drechslerella stenobrocha 248 TaxID=1043628 RepID=W7I1E7_9PEZI|nr:hypothetical protein DRE_04831 [Drechslerella stenobrocha 248]